MDIATKKLIVVGDGACGKTSLLIRYGTDKFLESYTPTVFDTYTVDVPVGNQRIRLTLYDTAGQEAYDKLRALSYTNTNVILLCYSIAAPDSLQSILRKWASEVRHYCPNVPVILVGNKKDLRDDLRTIRELSDIGQRPVESGEARAVAKQIKAFAYMECSSKNKRGVSEVFAKAIEATLVQKKIKNRACTVL